MSGRFRRTLHLSKRFFGALSPGAPRPDDIEWVATTLQPGELELWSRMPAHDRRHSIAVARRVDEMLAGAGAQDDRWTAAALLHDVGKLDAALGVVGRVGATVAGGIAGHDMADAWSQKRGLTRRVGLYLRHPELGAQRIELADGRPEAVAWARAHHDEHARAALEWPAPVVAALHDADDD